MRSNLELYEYNHYIGFSQQHQLAFKGKHIRNIVFFPHSMNC